MRGKGKVTKNWDWKLRRNLSDFDIIEEEIEY